jgi:hypothetical protein
LGGSDSARAGSGDNPAYSPSFLEFFMSKEFRTEADRLATPRPVPPKGVCFTAPRGQKRSLERGTATNNKKNPGKRAHQGG